MDKELFERITGKLEDIWLRKNAMYGNSFSQTFKEYGWVALMIRLSDKLNRAKIVTRSYDMCDDRMEETIQDTLMDMANYCIMALMELEKHDNVECMCD